MREHAKTKQPNKKPQIRAIVIGSGVPQSTAFSLQRSRHAHTMREVPNQQVLSPTTGSFGEDVFISSSSSSSSAASSPTSLSVLSTTHPRPHVLLVCGIWDTTKAYSTRSRRSYPSTVMPRPGTQWAFDVGRQLRRAVSICSCQISATSSGCLDRTMRGVTWCGDRKRECNNDEGCTIAAEFTKI